MSLDMYQRILEFTRDGIYRYEIETGIIQFANQGLVAILDLDIPPGALVGKRLRDLLIYTEKEGTIRQALQEKGELHRFEYHFRTLKGDDRWVLHDSFIVEDPITGCKSVEAIVKDITERKNAEEAIRQEREWLSTTLQSIGDGTIATDREGRIVLMNPVAETLTGWSFPEARNRPLSDIFSIINAQSRAPAVNPVPRVLQEGKLEGLANHTILVSRDGVEHQIADTAAPIFDRNRQIVGVILVFQDLTEKYRMQERLLQQQKMEALGNLTGGIAHDFNNMLTGILGFSQLLEIRLGDQPQLLGFAREIRSACQSAADLARKLLTFSRKKQFQGQAIDVHEPIRTVIGLLERTIDRRIQISTRFHAKPGVVNGEPTLLQNAFLNLAFNARDAMPQGGELMFATADVTLDEEYCKTHAVSLRPGPYIEIDIKDTGIGMTKEQLGHVFEPFFTTKALGRGTGLGLAEVFGTVKHHNGWVAVYSQPGMGTLIKIYIPAENVLSPTPKLKGTPPVVGTGLILVVDDEPIVRTTTAALLTELGYEVILAEDGEQAIEIYQREAERIRMVVLDIIMPKLCGRDAFRLLQNMDPGIKVLFSSGFVPGGIMDELLRMGAKGFVQKPFSLEVLSEAVSKVLAES